MKEKIYTFLFKEQKIRNISLIIFFTFFILNLILVVHHEAWRDEAQAWVLARNLNYKELFDILSTEGHPILWFLVLKYLIYIKLPFNMLSYFSLLIMCITVIFILKQKYLSIYEKIFIVFSPVCFYYNGVICRIYCIIPLLLFGIIWLRNRVRDIKYEILYICLIILVGQSHIFLAGLSIGLTIEYIVCSFIKRKKIQIFLGLLPLVNIILLVCELYQKSGNPTFIRIANIKILEKLSVSNVQAGINTVFRQLFDINVAIKFFTIELFISLIVVILLINKKIITHYLKEIFVSTCTLMWYIVVICFVRGADHPQMAIVGLELFLFCILLIQIKSKITILYQYIIIITCILCIPNMVKAAFFDYRFPFSNGKEMYIYIKNNVPLHSTIFVRESNLTPLIYSYLIDDRPDILLFSVDKEQKYSHHVWGLRYKKKEFKNIMDVFKKIGSNIDSFYISNNLIENNKTFSLIYRADSRNKWEENYYLYSVK